MSEGLSFCIVGAGPVGSSFAAHLASRGQRVSIVALGARLDAIRRSGISYQYPGGSLHVMPEAAGGPPAGVQDVVILCVKAQDLPPALRAVLPVIGDRTLVMPAVNGVPWWYFQSGEQVHAVDPDGELGRLLPCNKVVGCVVYMNAELDGSGAVRATTSPRLAIGSIDGPASDRIRHLADIFSSVDIATSVNDEIRNPLWTKIALNLATNPLSVVTEAMLQDLFIRAELVQIAAAILTETTRVATALGAPPSADLETMLAIGRRTGPFETSMLQDYRKGRPLELAAIADAVLELAGKVGVEMPVARTVIGLARDRAERRAERR